ncbi:MAG: preprotein translocase subunit SecG [Clostridia bacterium]|nr:preprotein translocase subunit SecG [Clostridia bacterium]
MDGREIFYLVSSIVLLISAIVLVVVILIQSNSSKGLSGAIAGGSDTFYGRNKGKSIDKKLMIVTIVLTVVFALLSLAVFSLQTNSATIQDWWNDLINNSQSSSGGSVTEDEEDAKDTSSEITEGEGSAEVTE